METYEALMDAAWPAPERHDTGEWTLRAAGGVTQRANSVWPQAEARDIPGAVREASLWYRRRRLPPIYQVTDTPRNAALNAVLDAQGYTRQSETLIMARSSGPDTSRTAPVRPPGRPAAELSDQPTDEWLDLWWSVDGRGGAPELETARTILTGCPSLYALVRSDDGAPAAVGRLALPLAPPLAGGGCYGGIYGMATRPGLRRQGLAGRVLHSLMEGAAEAGAEELWLLVTAANTGAQTLYAKAGFREAGRYAYRQERPLRARTGC
ncbi:GNAT family N-acetyltransferase [Arthrobacter sp. CDRTa11]|uniref:GNAT family N-acetyltransferase n=1 Tax=Arthrobacter sp. CDRTa11 TaxID=2651199 RepID=UPI002265D05B|nr:GNAT family N-acetyltransferase [Arthrobacter sp. CDRTa11]UZX05476.1 GNAT family N-acetyltransferase [Arthrobacter sp. CDRTa11]